MEDNNQSSKVKIYEPDKTLLNKVGKASLDQAFSSGNVSAAQSVINNTADEFYDACTVHLGELEELMAQIAQNLQIAHTYYQPLVDAAFALKAKAGLGGYEFASALAKSLHLYCENMDSKAPSKRDIEILRWHISCIRMVLRRKMKGNGGGVGAAIVEEIQKLTTKI